MRKLENKIITWPYHFFRREQSRFFAFHTARRWLGENILALSTLY